MNEAQKTYVLKNMKLIKSNIQNSATFIVHGSHSEACFTLGCLHQLCNEILETLEPMKENIDI
jgi:hypothetical protein